MGDRYGKTMYCSRGSRTRYEDEVGRQDTKRSLKLATRCTHREVTVGALEDRGGLAAQS